MAYIGRDIDKISNVEVLDNITFDGSSSYTLQKGGSNFTPSSANTLLVSIDGVVQAGNFTVSGSTINFGTAVSASSTCNFILHYGVGLITAPADGTVTTAKLADSSVTTAKLNDASVSLAKLTATGTKDATTFLRGDNTFAVPAGGTNTPNFAVYRQSALSIPNTTEVKVAYNLEDFDTASAYDSTTNYRFTVPSGQGGKYAFFASAAMQFLNQVNDFQINIKINGTTKFQGDGDAPNYPAAHVSAIVNLTAGDYVECWVYHSQGTTIDTQASRGAMFFQGFKIIE